MAIDGTYGFVYCGNNGLGIGIFTVNEDRLEGRDYFGVRYSGPAVEDEQENVHLDLALEVPSGVTLVPGTAPQNLPHMRPVRQTLPPAFGDGRPQDIDLVPGPVMIMVKRISDEYASKLSRGLAR